MGVAAGNVQSVREEWSGIDKDFVCVCDGGDEPKGAGFVTDCL